MKGIAILGSTGSIGTQALDVIRNHPDKFSVELLTAHNNIELLIKQAFELVPNTIVVTNEEHYEKLTYALSNLPIKIFCGNDAVEQSVQMDSIDLVLTAMVGFAGLKPTIAAIEAGKHIALANKETMVVAGKLVMERAEKKKVAIIPVDSEHSAIFQCLTGEFTDSIEKVILTASGGPFRGYGLDKLGKVTPAQALNHPNWCMGQKISIDSASMMNKGLEVIEAKWLFNIKPSQIEVVIHPQSIIHSLVQFTDGSIKAQMGLPDMRLPIQYAFAYPLRIKSEMKRFSFTEYPNLNFEMPDYKNFRNLAISFKALERGGNWPCIMNAANEVAVQSFLEEKISFPAISDVIEETLVKSDFKGNPKLNDLIFADESARAIAKQLI